MGQATQKWTVGSRDDCQKVTRFSRICQRSSRLCCRKDNRELKQRKFSGRRRLEWQREAGTDVAVASRQIQLFKRQVHSDGDGVAFQRKK